MVVKKYDGALKAEHGTGRNMAPFVETEWGGEIYQLMKAPKQCINPENLFNPAVIITGDPLAQLRDLKKLRQVEREVHTSMDCVSCDNKCPSRNLPMTPRQWIVIGPNMEKLKT